MMTLLNPRPISRIAFLAVLLPALLGPLGAQENDQPAEQPPAEQTDGAGDDAAAQAATADPADQSTTAAGAPADQQNQAPDADADADAADADADADADAADAEQQADRPRPSAETTSDGISFRNFRGASLFEVIDLFARQLKINYILDPAVTDGAVTINTYGTLQQSDLFPLFETILRINGAVAVKVGALYRIVPAENATHLPISPQSSTIDSLPFDEQMILNAIRLRYALAADIAAVLEPFLGEGAKYTVVETSNILLVLDNSRNMRRTMQLIDLLDAEHLDDQRIRLVEVKNGLAAMLAQELQNIFSAFSSSEETSAVRFVPIQRINAILVVSANTSMFKEVEKWIEKLDTVTTTGGIQNFIYRVQYGMATNLAGTLLQLYGYGMGMGGYGMGGYGMGGYGMGGYGGGMGGYGGGMGGYGGGMGGYGWAATAAATAVAAMVVAATAVAVTAAGAWAVAWVVAWEVAAATVVAVSAAAESFSFRGNTAPRLLPPASIPDSAGTKPARYWAIPPAMPRTPRPLEAFASSPTWSTTSSLCNPRRKNGKSSGAPSNSSTSLPARS